MRSVGLSVDAFLKHKPHGFFLQDALYKEKLQFFNPSKHGAFDPIKAETPKAKVAQQQGASQCTLRAQIRFTYRPGDSFHVVLDTSGHVLNLTHFDPLEKSVWVPLEKFLLTPPHVTEVSDLRLQHLNSKHHRGITTLFQ